MPFLAELVVAIAWPFAQDFCNYLERMKWFVSGWFIAMMKPFWGKANDEMFKGFIKPLFKTYTEGLFVIFGYPAIKFEKGIRRSFANINHLQLPN